MLTIFRAPAVCSWCYRKFVDRKYRAWLCDCTAVTCRPKDSACFSLHFNSPEHGALPV